jgi:branched-chain amino acid aminotransferase
MPVNLAPSGNMVWIDGGLADAAVARVSPFDHGLLTGDGVFESLRVSRSVPFAVRRHLERLARSAAGLRLPCPPAEVVRAAMGQVVAANGLEEGRLRVTVTAGPAPLGSDRADVEPTVIVAGGPLPAWPPAADVVVSPWPRNERSALAGLKTTSYGENVVALAHARDHGAGEAIFANLKGHLCEGTGTNVFVGVSGRLVTPPLSTGCLAGVTRELLLELVEAEEADLPVAALASADEAFLTSSTRDVQPVRAVDGRRLATCPGPLTVAAAGAFRDLLDGNLDP